MRRPRILVVHCLVEAHGGSSGVLAWMLEALCPDHDVTVLTWAAFDVSALNRFFGTTLDTTLFQVRLVPPVLKWLFDLDPDPGSVQRNSLLMRLAKSMRRRYDLVVSGDNEADFGAPALQYVHVPFLAHLRPHVLPSCDLSLTRKLAAVCRGRIRPWMLVADYSFERMARNRTLANSDWTGRWLRRAYGIDAVTLHPPAPGAFPMVPWEQRENGFVVLGRFHPAKRPDWCVRVLGRVRERCPDLRVHLMGSASAWKDEQDYYGQLTRLADENRSWVTLHANLPRPELARLVSQQRFGMHAMQDEHFGMAVAEMVLGGCIPFVHDSGGPPEIVGHDARVIYDSEDEAVAKIVLVLGDPAAQRDIRMRLDEDQDRLRPEAFVRRFRAEVARMLRGDV